MKSIAVVCIFVALIAALCPFVFGREAQNAGPVVIQPAQVQPPTAAEMRNMTPAQVIEITKQFPGKFELVFEDNRGGTATATDTGNGIGAGARLSGTDLKNAFDASAPGVNLGAGYSATGGSYKGSMSAMGMIPLAEAWKNPLFWVGLGLIGTAGVLAYLGMFGPAGWTAAGGILAMSVAFYPWLTLWALAAVLIVGVIIYVRKHQAATAATAANAQTTGALTGIVAAIDSPSVSPAAADAVKAAISAQPNSAQIKAVVSPIKAKTNTVKQAGSSITAELAALESRLLATFRRAVAAPVAAAPQPIIVQMPPAPVAGWSSATVVAAPPTI